MARGPVRRWTSEEDERLRQWAGGWDELAPVLGRSRSAVTQRAMALGVRNRHAWTPAQDRELAALLAHLRHAEVAEILGRPVQGVYTRAWRLGLESPHSRGRVGPEHPSWKGGQRNNYGRTWYRLIRPAVLERDGWRCLECAGTRRLTAHHIVPWHVTWNNALHNHATLCWPCHARQAAHAWADESDIDLRALPAYQRELIEGRTFARLPSGGAR